MDVKACLAITRLYHSRSEFELRLLWSKIVLRSFCGAGGNVMLGSCRSIVQSRGDVAKEQIYQGPTSGDSKDVKTGRN